MSDAGHLADLCRRAFAAGRRGERRMGAEAELLVLEAETHAPVGIPSSLPFLRRFGAEAGWREERNPAGAPLFRTPGGTLSFEPGGQLELSTPPCDSVDALLCALRGVLLPLREAALESGVELLGVGVDPFNPIERVPLQLQSERYLRMDAHLRALGPAGPRMMRQTAALQVSVDWEDEPVERWRLLNAAAPFLTAIFANSPRYAGADTGARSFRALTWRETDPARTGIFPGVDPVEEYRRFALAAPMILPRAGWETHLSTLFPEIRPRGFAEVRSMDALPPEGWAAPLVLLAGMVYDRTARVEAAELLGPPDSALLPRSARDGLTDPEIARTAADLVEIGMRGARRLPRFVGDDALESADDFFQRVSGRRPESCPAGEG